MDPTTTNECVGEVTIVGSDNHAPTDLALFSLSEPNRGNISLDSWLENELVSSERWRGGDRRRAVWLSTPQGDTLSVAREIFGLHGVEVLRVPPWIDIGTDSSSLLNIEHKGLSILGVLAERSALNEAPYFSLLQCHDKQIKVIQDTSLYPHRSGEISSIEMTLSLHVRDLLRYDKPGGDENQAINGERAVDFSIDPGSFLLDHPKVYTAIEGSKAFLNVVTTALNEGIFFICPENRRQKHVYYTGLHSGLPLPPKSTIEELPRQILHDLVHELMPDPILMNNVETTTERRFYLAHRVIAEVVAFSIEGLWFSDLLSEEGVPREDSAAQLYRYLNLSLSDGSEQVTNLKRLIKANIDLLLKGNTQAFEEILDNSPESRSALSNYQQEMTKFLIGDLHWSENSLATKVLTNSAELTWDLHAVDTLGKHGLIRETVPQAVMRLGQSQLSNWDQAVDTVFEDIYLNKIKPVICAEYIAQEPRSLCISKAFVRWTVWQMSLLFRFPNLPETEKAHEKISAILDETRVGFSDHNIAAVRGIFDEYVGFLRSERYINFDDEMTFREVVPIFRPYYLRFQEYEGLNPSVEAERLIHLDFNPLSTHAGESESISRNTIAHNIRLRRATEPYSTFEELRRHNKEGSDWEIAFKYGEKRYLCAAWHGGYVEPGSDKLAELIAGDTYDFFAFRALHPVTGIDHPLHITSTKFDEPTLIEMAQQSERVISIHCCTTHPNFSGILVGGGASHEEKITLVNFLRDQGYNAELDQILLGRHAKNPCNMGKYPGFQIEIPQPFMDSLVNNEPQLSNLADAFSRFLAFKI